MTQKREAIHVWHRKVQQDEFRGVLGEGVQSVAAVGCDNDGMTGPGQQSPQDLAAVVLFLASDAARAIHGAALPVTGLS